MHGVLSGKKFVKKSKPRAKLLQYTGEEQKKVKALTRVHEKEELETMTIQELERLIALYGKDIFSFCVHLTGSRQEAEELYQDTFLKAVERIGSIREDGNQKSYILSVALNLWKNRRRKFAWRQRIAPRQEPPCGQEYPEEGTAEDALSGLLKEERRFTVREAVRGLPDRYRIPVLLYYMEELPVAEIARAMGIPEGTVKSRLSAARKLLKKELEGYFYEERTGAGIV